MRNLKMTIAYDGFKYKGWQKQKDTDLTIHARYNVKSKTYVYKINNNKFRNVFNRKYIYHLAEKLNLPEMRKASEVLIGSHDFKSFTNSRNSDKSTIRTINYFNIIENDGIIEIEVNGNGFLWNMVRVIAGTLIEVGKGNLKPIDVEKILNEKKRLEAGPLAQAKGLFLRDVQY